MSEGATSTTETTSTGTEETGSVTTAEQASTAEESEQGIFKPDAETKAEETSTTEEQKGEETEAQKSEGETGSEADTVPETYEFSLPEGMELDKEGAEQFTALGHELGITQAQADKLSQFYVDRMQQQAKLGVDSLIAQAEAQSQTWREETLAEKDIGEAGVAIATRAVERFGSDSLKQWLKESGMGNHPELVRFCMRVGNAIAEDTFETGTGGGAKIDDTALQERGFFA